MESNGDTYAYNLLLMLVLSILVSTLLMVIDTVIINRLLSSVVGIAGFMAIYIPVAYLVPLHHNRAKRLYNKKEYIAAIEEFEMSYHFFNRHKLVDKFRFITAFSGSNKSFRELALCYIADSYTQLGNPDKAMEYYEAALREFPKCSLAKDTLLSLRVAQEMAEYAKRRS